MNINEEISHEQGADVRRIGQYVRNWWRLVRAGVVVRSSVFFTLLLARVSAVCDDVLFCPFVVRIPGRLLYMVVWYTPSASRLLYMVVLYTPSASRLLDMVVCYTPSASRLLDIFVWYTPSASS